MTGPVGPWDISPGQVRVSERSPGSGGIEHHQEDAVQTVGCSIDQPHNLFISSRTVGSLCGTLERRMCRRTMMMWKKKLTSSRYLARRRSFFGRIWPQTMQLSQLNEGTSHFTIWGECPHCSPVKSAFQSVTSPFETKMGSYEALVAVCRCIACRRFILAALCKNGPNYSWIYAYHYPIGQPSDSVSKDLPANITSHLSEALRCQWVKETPGDGRDVPESDRSNLYRPRCAVQQGSE